MYDTTYMRYIYEWLQSSGLNQISGKMDRVLDQLGQLLTWLQYATYAVTFFFFFWMVQKLLQNLLYK